MATAYSKGDTLGIYHTRNGMPDGDHGLGGRRDALELSPLFYVGRDQIAPLVILAISGNNTGNAYISAKTESTLALTGTDGTEGAASTCGARASVLLEDTDGSKWVRVYRDTDYSDADLGGFFNLSCFPIIHGVVGGTAVTKSASVQNYYGALMLTNHSALGQALTVLRAWVGTLGTQRLSGTTQLPGAGAGTIQTATSNGFADWPNSGWVRITTNAPALREIAYYSSRTATVLTVPADGRGRLGTAAAAGAATDSIDPVPGIRIGYEAVDAFGEIQTIASATTAPAAVTWNTEITSALGLNIGTLNPRGNVGLWIHREIPANVTANVLLENKIMLGYTVDGTAYTNRIRGCYRIKDTALALVKLWLGVDANPNLAAAPDATAAVFPSVVITPPVSGISEYRITCRRSDAYGLTSHDTDYQSVWVNSAGVQVAKPINSPTDISLQNDSGGVALLMAKYQSKMDASPADQWKIYWTVTGVNPDPAVDTPITISMTNATYNKTSMFDSSTALYYSFATQAFNADLRVIVRAHRSSDATQSRNSTVSQITINTVANSTAIIPQVFSAMETDYSSKKALAILSNTALAGVWVVTIHPDEFMLYSGTTVVLRSTIREYNKGRIFIPASFNLVNIAHSAAAADSTKLIEAVDANTAYILVGTTRRAKINLTAGTIEAAEFDWGIGITDEIPVNSYAWGNSTTTYLLQYNPVRGRYVPWLKLTSGGVLSTAFPITQRRS